MGMILETTGLYKNFKGQTAVNKVSLHVEKNSVYGLLGPNGAGKSTTLKMITGILKPTSGTILDEPANGLDPVGIEELRELICSLPAKGITVILSSHILSEVQQVADHVGIIAGGVLGYEGELHAGENLEQLFMDVIRENRRVGEEL